MIKMIYSQRETPSCGRADCDITENPEHWVDAEPENATEIKELRKTIRRVTKALKEVPGYFDQLQGEIIPVHNDEFFRASQIRQWAVKHVIRALRRKPTRSQKDRRGQVP